MPLLKNTSSKEPSNLCYSRKMKQILALIIISLLFFSGPVSTYASLLVVEDNGEIIWNVLSEETSVDLGIPRHSYIEVKRAAETQPPQSSVVKLTRENDKVSLVVSSDSETRELDVTNWNETLVEIEERPETQRLTIGMKDNKFKLQQRGISALTDFPVSVDSKKAQLSVQTTTGEKFISIFPYQATEAALRTKIVNRLESTQIEIIEKESKLQYLIHAQKVFNFFDVYEYVIPITTYISASTGEVLGLEGPGWLKYISFLFT